MGWSKGMICSYSYIVTASEEVVCGGGGGGGDDDDDDELFVVIDMGGVQPLFILSDTRTQKDTTTRLLYLI